MNPGQEGYGAEGEGNDEIDKLVGLVCIRGLKCGSIGHSNIPLFEVILNSTLSAKRSLGLT